MTPARKIYGFVSLKGGVGKTTSSGYFAECLRLASRSVTGLDTDPQKGWIKWHDTGNLVYPVHEADANSLRRIVKEINGDIVIDTPPNDSRIIMNTCLLADEIIVTVAPTAHDMARIKSTLDVIESVEESRGVELHSVLITRLDTRKKVINQQMLAALEENDIAYFQSMIPSSTRFETFGPPTFVEPYQAVYQELENSNASNS